MSLPPPPPASLPDPLPDDDVAALEVALAATSPGRIAWVLNAVQVGIWGLCLAATATGGLALGLGVWASEGQLVGIAVVLVVALPAIGLPLYVARRSSALADAVTHPAEVLAQSQDLARGLTAGPELRSLVGMLRGRRRGGGGGRIRRTLRSGRLVVSLIGLAGPDPKRHPLLVPFTPQRLRRLWLAALAALGWWLAAAVFAAIAALALLVQLVT